MFPCLVNKTHTLLFAWVGTHIYKLAKYVFELVDRGSGVVRWTASRMVLRMALQLDR